MLINMNDDRSLLLNRKWVKPSPRCCVVATRCGQATAGSCCRASRRRGTVHCNLQASVTPSCQANLHELCRETVLNKRFRYSSSGRGNQIILLTLRNPITTVDFDDQACKSGGPEMLQDISTDRGHTITHLQGIVMLVQGIHERCRAPFNEAGPRVFDVGGSSSTDVQAEQKLFALMLIHLSSDVVNQCWYQICIPPH